MNIQILFHRLFLPVVSICFAVSCTQTSGNPHEDNPDVQDSCVSKPINEYVDLGLSSGTLWSNQNEVNEADPEYNFFAYNEAMDLYGDKLPSKKQWEELKKECQWDWIGDGYNITGPNGNSIVLPAKGYGGCDGSVYNVGSFGNYWSSTPYESDYAWYLIIDWCGIGINCKIGCDGSSVRLVLNS